MQSTEAAQVAHTAGKYIEKVMPDKPMLSSLVKWYLANHWHNPGIEMLVAEIMSLPVYEEHSSGKHRYTDQDEGST